MRARRFKWRGPTPTARDVRIWDIEAWTDVEKDVAKIHRKYVDAENADAYLLELTARFDATEKTPTSLVVEKGARKDALSRIDPELRQSLEVAAENIRSVATAQLGPESQCVQLPQGQTVTVRETAVKAAGIYAPGGRAAYPSSVLMCAIPARVAGVSRVALATPPGPTGSVNPVVLAAAELCGIDDVYALGGAQAIFALAYGSNTIRQVNVVAGPGNAWVREAKRRVSGLVAIDSLAGPSELAILLDDHADIRWAAFDLCAQAEHGVESPLVVVATNGDLLQRVHDETERIAASRSGVANAPLALVHAPNNSSAIKFLNVFAPEHLQLMTADAVSLAPSISTAGCVFAGMHSATAFGDYAAGSNHVLPTSAAGRFSGPLGPDVFRRKIATVEVPPEAAAKLAPHVDTIARAEGFPVHGESAMIRARDSQ